MDYSNNAWLAIKQALEIVGLIEPTCLFIAADVRTEYLHFAEVDYKIYKKHKAKLDLLGVVFIAKYATLGIERERLWDMKNEI